MTGDPSQLAELADPALPSERIESIFKQAIALWGKALTTTTPGPTDLLCALARHPSLPLRLVRDLTRLSAGADAGAVDWPAVRAALDENPSLKLHRMAGELGGRGE